MENTTASLEWPSEWSKESQPDEDNVTAFEFESSTEPYCQVCSHVKTLPKNLFVLQVASCRGLLWFLLLIALVCFCCCFYFCVLLLMLFSMLLQLFFYLLLFLLLHCRRHLYSCLSCCVYHFYCCHCYRCNIYFLGVNVFVTAALALFSPWLLLIMMLQESLLYCRILLFFFIYYWCSFLRPNFIVFFLL